MIFKDRGIEIKTPEQIAGMHRGTAHYVLNAQRFATGLKKIG